MGKILSMKLGTQEDLEKLNLGGPSIGSTGRSYILAGISPMPLGGYETFKIPSGSSKKKKGSLKNNSEGESKK